MNNKDLVEMVEAGQPNRPRQAFATGKCRIAGYYGSTKKENKPFYKKPGHMLAATGIGLKAAGLTGYGLDQQFNEGQITESLSDLFGGRKRNKYTKRKRTKRKKSTKRRKSIKKRRKSNKRKK